MLRRVSKAVKQTLKTISELRQPNSYPPTYRIVEINKLDTEEHIVIVQIINKNILFQIKPEDILANDDLVDQFSPRDIRTLTYLGYLSINYPKYKILAQRLSEQNDKILFALQQKGEKKILVKTADEILLEKTILQNLTPQDAQIIGYTVASESILNEKQLKEDAKKALKKN